MALGQFVIYLIPLHWAQENNFNATLLYDKNDMFDTDFIWYKNQPKINIEIYLLKFLPKATSWSTDLLCFGDTTGNDIQIDFEKNKLTSIQMRIDVTQNINNFANDLLSISKDLDCIFFYPELKTMSEATANEFYTAIKQSTSYRFIENPHKFFTDLSNKN